MFQLKTISADAIPGALAKAERYRLLNEPREAESICLDVLHVDPTNQHALVTLLLALTDQFHRERGADITRARDILPRVEDAYERLYYDGVICERLGKAQLQGGGHARAACDWLSEAMTRFDKAQSISPPGNNDAILRWNSCARLVMLHERREPGGAGSDRDLGFGDDIPLA